MSKWLDHDFAWHTHLFYFQVADDSLNCENPFRVGGELSNDAMEIIDALKTGKLNEAIEDKQESHHFDSEPKDQVEKVDSPKSNHNISTSSKEDIASSHTKEVEVERGLVINPKQADIEHVLIPEKKKKDQQCCTLQ